MHHLQEFEALPTHFFANDLTNVDYMRPHMEEYLTREADMGGIAVMMALINDIIKAYEENAL